MTVEELLAALQAIIDEAAAAAEEGAEPALTEEQASRYEDLERQLAVRRRSDGILTRNATYGTVDQRQRVPAGGRQTAAAERDDELTRAFMHYVRTGQPNQDIAQLRYNGGGETQYRAQGEGNGPTGGFLVPEGFRDRLIERMVAFGGLAQHVEEFSTSTGNALPWPTLDDTANLGEIVAEHGTFSSGADLVFGTASLSAYRYMAGGASSTPLRVSVELAQDSAFDIESLVNRKLGERIGRMQARHWVRGTGVNEPEGLITGRTVANGGAVEIAADGSGITYDDLITFEHSVDPAYREGGRCRWAFNDATLAVIKKLKDSHGDPLWRPNTADMGTGTGGGTLNGYPVIIDQAFPDVSVADNTVNWGAFGDFTEAYVIRRVREVVLVVNPWTRASYGEIEYTAWARADGAQQNVNAYKALTGEQ